jgi:hypothetical protein
MTGVLLFAAAISFFLHLASETVSTFFKYNFSGLGRQMVGVSYANIFALVSRGFIAVYGVLISIVIERNLTDMTRYAIVFAVVCILGSCVSIWLSKIKFVGFVDDLPPPGWRDVAIRIRAAFRPNDHQSVVRIRGLTSIAIGTQFLSVVIAYGLCFAMPSNRLMIISMVPVFSTVGALLTFVWVEPRLARMIDADNSSGYAASREFLRARGLSFAACAVVILAMGLVFSL